MRKFTQISGVIFIIHSVQLILLGISNWYMISILIIFALFSLLTGLLLLKAPIWGLGVGLFRSICGIFFAVNLRHFLNFELLVLKGDGILWVWPSIFFSVFLMGLFIIALNTKTKLYINP